MVIPFNNPLLPSHEDAYQAWREAKLRSLPADLSSIFVEIDNPQYLTQTQRQAIIDRISATNMALFRLADPSNFTASDLKALGSQLGLDRLDDNLYADEQAISELRVIEKGRRGEYIPYTNRALGWHTDGYYNSPQHTIRAFMLYCEADAASGGENQLLDPELVYIHLRDKNPAFIESLMKDDVLTIPETIENGRQIRPTQQSAVFSIEEHTGALLMRYTQRKTYIQWKDDPMTREALTYLGEWFADDAAPILHYRLKPGEGLICNNVLHNRSAFENSAEQQRVMYRARYYDRVTNQ
jgi:alpha-ketoglutarate-dependent taurine dioxygenase